MSVYESVWCLWCVLLVYMTLYECVCGMSVTWQEGVQLWSLWVSGAGLQPPLVQSMDLLPLGLKSFQGTLISPHLKPPPSPFAISVLVKSLLVISVDLDVEVEAMECFLDNANGCISGCSKHLACGSLFLHLRRSHAYHLK